jgi:signal-transduction protein with cAMP-binding, CBS, and nucleotidyltransferase domain
VLGPSELDELETLELEKLQLALDELAELGGSELDELIERLERLLDDLLYGGKNEEVLAELLEELIAELLEELLMLLNKPAQTTPPIDGRCAGLLATPLLPCTPNSID